MFLVAKAQKYLFENEIKSQSKFLIVSASKKYENLAKI